MIQFHAQVHVKSTATAAIMPFCLNEGSPFVEAKLFPSAIDLPDTFSNKHCSHLPVPGTVSFKFPIMPFVFLRHLLRCPPSGTQLIFQNPFLHGSEPLQVADCVMCQQKKTTFWRRHLVMHSVHRSHSCVKFSVWGLEVVLHQ